MEANLHIFKEELEELYKKYNSRKWAKLDPVHFIYRYDDPADMEIVALVASCFAYGRVEHILKTVDHILEPMGQSPSKFLVDNTPGKLAKVYPDFRHRFQTTRELVGLLSGARAVIKRYGSMEKAFLSKFSRSDENIIPVLTSWRNEIYNRGSVECGHLLPDPARKSACKRLFMFLRWLVRKDKVDVGIWKSVGAENLVLPLDVHLHRWCVKFQATTLKAPSLKAAVEASRAFAAICPADPVKYDFALAHEGMESIRGR